MLTANAVNNLYPAIIWTMIQNSTTATTTTAAHWSAGVKIGSRATPRLLARVGRPFGAVVPFLAITAHLNQIPTHLHLGVLRGRV
ncbi:MAG: hypothetical protein CSA55_02405 [Ilumatobacter coccineus]|uniref:Uncharacterized protein n=1 Tax=Ilumatobacter coccineus TaxID=467094 RepID=A0A2G6KE40_9ACTN|nr:MAG: hypothetical protein CSA55_02405 [Ilumatobacter coccineus]